ncbi:MAG: beta-lactamase family protein [Mangrovicoccus sp.]|nr:beta-lactamase family protein [Mangrovicoccus sp.]
MRALGKWLGRTLLVLFIGAVALGLWKREEITRLLAVNSLFDEGNIVENFSNMQALFPIAPLPLSSATPSPLPQGAKAELPATVDQWLDARSVTSLLVLKDGEIVFEEYYQGTKPEDLRISWSVAKSYLSALMGIMLEEGAIASLDDLASDYTPSLADAAYDGVTIRQVLTMSSGVEFDEDYLDYHSDINRMGRVLALGHTMDDFALSITQTFTEPGSDWQYTSIDTHVLGMVIRGATGRSIPELLNEKILQPLALEQEPHYLTDGAGTAFVLGGLNFTTRDYARFGQMIAQGGEWRGRQIVPRDWILASTSPQAPTGPGEFKYGYQWWMPEDLREREYLGRGIYGQYIYISEPEGVVIVSTAADRKFRSPEVSRENIDIFRQIVDGL